MRRNTNSFNLSFIDIISCGLGAVVLLLILIKDSPFFVEQEIKDIEQALPDNSDLKSVIEKFKSENNELSELIITKKKDLSELDKKITEKLKNKNILQKEISSLIVSDDEEENRNFLSSCKLDRDKTLVLLDSSASMLDYNFVDILKAKASSEEIKQQSNKFNTAKRILEWLIQQAEDEVRIDVATFSGRGTFLSDGLKFKKDIINNPDYLKKISEILPNGETNLYKAFEDLKLENYRSVFFITDGLPTSGNGSISQSIRGCNTGSLVSSDCREGYFTDAFSYLNKKNSRIQINTILMYLEGDPRASLRFSKESWRDKGCFITIPRIWP